MGRSSPCPSGSRSGSCSVPSTPAARSSRCPCSSTLGELAKDATTESLLVVGTAAPAGAADHARIGRVEVRTGLIFGAAGVSGAIVGTALNRLVGGRAILLAFALLLLVAAVAMLRRAPESPTRGRKPSFVRVAPVGLGTGVLPGFLGVRGVFVIVPALVLLLGCRWPWRSEPRCW